MTFSAKKVGIITTIVLATLLAIVLLPGPSNSILVQGLRALGILTPVNSKIPVSTKPIDAATLAGKSGLYYLNAANLTGVIDPERFSAYDSLVAEGKIDPDSVIQTDKNSTPTSTPSNLDEELSALRVEMAQEYVSSIEAGLGLAGGGGSGGTQLSVVPGEGIIIQNDQVVAVLGDSVNLLSEVAGVLAIANGGTGLSAPLPAGKILTSNGSGYVAGTLAAGDGVSLQVSGNTYTYELDTTVCRTSGNCSGSGGSIVGGGSAGQLAFFTDGSTLSSSAGLAWNSGTSRLTITGSINSTGGYLVNGVSLSTSHVLEGSNLYYTQGRFDTAFAGKDTDDLAEGVTALYWSNARFDSRLATKSTSDLVEGSRLYYTDTRVSANADVTANTAARHAAATILDSSTLNLSIVGQQISGSVIQSGLQTSLLNNDAGFIANLTGFDTDDLAEGATNWFFTTGRFDSAFAGKDTDDLAEGITNFYFTDGRFDTAFGNKDSDDLAEGVTNQFFTALRFDTAFSFKTTTDLAEGANLYYTEGRVAANTDVVANTAARHVAATITDTTTVDLVLLGQNISANVIQANLQTSLLNNDAGFITGLGSFDSDDLAEGATNQYFTALRFDTAFGGKTTDDLAEGVTNLYFSDTLVSANADVAANTAARHAAATVLDSATLDLSITGQQISGSVIQSGLQTSLMNNDAGFVANLSSFDTDDLAEGAANFYFTSGRFDTQLATKDTDDLAEGATNLYSQWANNTTNITFGNSVGIGAVTAPTTTLDVTGTFKVSGAVTLSNFAINGGILYTSGSGVVAQLSAGGSGQCLVSNGASSAPSWAGCADSGTLTGSGSTGQLAYFSSASSLSGSATLVWNDVDDEFEVTGDVDVTGGYLVNGSPITTDEVAEGAVALYWTDGRFDSRLATKDADDLVEGTTNLYYTDTRVSANVDVAANTAARHSAATVSDTSTLDLTIVGQLISGSVIQSGLQTSLMNNDAGFIANLTGFDSDDLAEGLTNLYYTEGRVSANTDVAANTSARHTAATVLDSTTINFTLTGQQVTGVVIQSAIQTSLLNNDVGFIVNLTGFDTDDLAEGVTNKYYSDALFSASLALRDTDDLAEGATNLYYTTGRFDTAFSGKDSDDLAEGLTNLYSQWANNTTNITFGNSVGIGAATAPTATLDLTGSFKASGAITLSSFTANGGVLYTNGSGVVAQTTVGGAGECLKSAGGGAPTWGSCATSSAITGAGVAGQVAFFDSSSNIAGDTGLTWNSTTNVLSVNGSISMTGDIIPSVDDTYSLGSATFMWQDVYIGPGSLYINGQKVLQESGESIVVSADPGQNLSLATAGGGDLELTAAGGGIIQLKSNVQLTGGTSITTSDTTAVLLPNGIRAGNIQVSGNAITTTNLNGDIAFTPNGAGDSYFTTGNLGIGNSNPGHRLDVTGSINASTGYLLNGVALSTTNIAEGTNLYYTQGRFDTAFGVKDTDDLSEGLTNLYFTDARVSANTDVAANTAVRHSVATILDSATLDLSITGQQISGTVIQSGLQTSLLNNDAGFIVNLTGFDTDDLAEGTTNKYWSQALFDAAFGAKSTTNLVEGTNLYYTSARFTTDFNTKTTDNLTEGTTNKYFTTVNFDAAFGAKDTDDLAEGVTNLYYSDALVSANSDVAANTSARHDAATVLDSLTIDFSLSGQQITGSVLGDSLNFTELADALTLDAPTSLALGSNTLSTSGTGGITFGHAGDTLFSGDIGIGTSSPHARLDLADGGANGSFLIGADVNLTTRTANTRKIGRIVAPNYAGDGTGFNIFVLGADTNATENIVDFGGVASGTPYAATKIRFYTAATNTTQGGTEAMQINSSQNVGIGLTPAAVHRLQVRAASNQFRADYDASNAFALSVNSTGQVTMDSIGSGSGFVLSDSTSITGALTVSGTTTLSSYSTDGGLLYTNGSGLLIQTAVGGLGECLQSSGGGAPTWGACGDSISADSLDFDDFADAMTLDASTSINIGGFDLSTSGTGTLTLGHTGLTALSGNLAIGADKTLKITGGSSFPGSATEGEIFYRTDTDQLYTYTGSKWQADRSTATLIVAASNSQNKEKADYVADGTNDETEIEAAIGALPAGGGMVVLLEGTFSIGSDVTITKSNVNLMGSGRSTILQRAFNDTTVRNSGVITVGNATNSYSGITIANLRIDGQKATHTSDDNHGIFFNEKISFSAIRDSLIADNAGEGIFFSGYALGTDAVEFNTIANNEIKNNNLNGIGFIYFSNYNLITSNLITGNTEDGIHVEAFSTHNRITNNTVKSNSGHGIQAYYSVQNTLISGNTVESNIDTGISVHTTADETVVSGNVVNNQTGISLHIYNSDYVSASGNTLSGGSIGISVGTSNNSAFTGNTISASTGNGITLYISDNNLVANNRIHNIGGTGANHGIYINGGSDGNTVTGNTITDTAGTGYAISINSDSANNVLSINRYSGTGAGSISDGSTSTVYNSQQFGTSGDLILKPTGNIGLGLTAPTAQLHLKGNVATSLSGTFGVTNASASVNTSIDQTGVLAVGDSIRFASQSGSVYTILSLNSSTITLTSNYTGSSNASTVATRDAANLLEVDNGAGVSKLALTKTGNLTLGGYSVDGGLLYTNSSGEVSQTATGSGGQCLQSNGGGAPTWGSCGGESTTVSDTTTLDLTLTGQQISGTVIQSGLQTSLFNNDAGFIANLSTFDTDDLAEGTTNKYFSDALFGTSLATRDTDDLAEGATNLYYTTARFSTDLGTKTTTDLAEGTNLYWTSLRFDSAFSGKDTDDLAEGVTNLYYSDALVSANSDVAANTSARHDAATVLDSLTIDFSLSGQQITGSVLGDSLNFTELADALTLDASTSIGLGANALSTSGTGGVNFAHTGNTTFAGNVGIGPNTPGSALHISNTGDAVLTIEADTDNATEGDNPSIVFKQDGGTSYLTLGVEGNSDSTFTNSKSNTGYIMGQGGEGLSLATGGTSRMYISNGGLIGIGSQTSPGALLHLKGATDQAITGTVSVTSGSAAVVGTGTNFTGQLAVGDAILIGGTVYEIATITDATNLTLDVVYAGSTSSGLTAYMDATMLAVTQGDSDRILTLDKSGNFGLGTSSPNAKLDIRGVMEIHTTGGTTATGKIVFSDSGSGGSEDALIFDDYDEANSSSNSLFSLRQDGNDVFNLYGGNLGLGTSTPGAHRLYVSGTMLVTGGVTFTNYTTDGGILYTDGSGIIGQTATGSAGECLQSNAGGAPTWGICYATVADSLNFDDLSDTLSLDVSTDIAIGPGLTLSTSGSGTVSFGHTGLTSFTGDVTVTGGELVLAAQSSSASTTEGTLYYDSDDDQLKVYANGKWQADRSSVTKIVAASDSQNKEKADYVADGAADEVEIQAAIDALPVDGGSVVLLEGNYNISSPINLKNYVNITGQGSGTYLIRSGAGYAISAVGTSSNSIFDVSISQLWITGPSLVGAQVQGAGIFLDYTSGVRIQNVWLDSFGAQEDDGAIMIRRSDFCSISDSWFAGSKNGIVTGVATDASYEVAHCSFTNNQVRDNYDDGIHTQHAKFITISNNHVYDNGASGGDSAGIDLLGDESDTVVGNIVTGTTQKGIEVGNSTIVGIADTGHTISGNTVSGNGTDGILVANSSKEITISSNTARANGGHGISLGTSSATKEVVDSMVIGNITTGNGTDGIRLTGNSHRNMVKDNTSLSNSNRGLSITVASSQTPNANIVEGNTFASNTVSQFSNAGTNTVIRFNVGTTYDIQVNNGDTALDIDGTLTASGAITFSSFTTDGGILYTNGSGVLAQTTAGSAGECLQSSAGGAPTWGSCGGSIAADSLDFDDFADALTLDASTSIDLGSNTLSTSGTGGITFSHTGDTSFAGRVGIGQTPGMMLDVMKTGNNDPIARFGSAGVSDSQAVQVYNGSGSLKLFISGNTGSFLTGATQGDTGIQYSAGDDFHIGEFGVGAQLTVQSGGNVGVGTTTPDRKFEIEGTGVDGLNGDSDLRITGTGGTGAGIQLSSTGTGGREWTIFSTNNSASIGGGALAFWDKNASEYRMLIDSSGNVSIVNFTTNGGVVWANGSGVLAQTTAGSAGQCLQSNAGGAPTWGSCGGSVGADSLDFDDFADALTLDASTDIAFGANNLTTSGTGELNFGHSGETSFAGEVGFGTTNPDSALDVRGSLTIQNTAGVNTDDIVIKRPGVLSSTNAGLSISQRSDNTSFMIYGYDGTTYKNFVTLDYDLNSVSLGNNNQLEVDADGGVVRVGNGGAQTDLEVYGGLYVGDNTNGKIQLYSDTDAWWWMDNDGGTLRFSSAANPTDTNAVIISSAGYLGIGDDTGNPEFALDVEGTVKVGGDTQGSILLQPSDGGAWFWLDNPDADYLRFSAAASPTDTNAMVFTSAGELGIGTTNPGASLDLSSGTIAGAGLTSCSGVNDKLQWSSTTKQFSCLSEPTSTIIRKSADESVTSSTVLQDDDELSIAVGANETWVVEVVAQGVVDAAPDIQLAVSAPSGSTCDISLQDNQSFANTASLVNCGVAMIGSGNGTMDLYYVYATIITGATPGNITFQYTQNTTSANAVTISAGSYLKAQQIGASAGGGGLSGSDISPDALNFTEFADTLTLDAPTTINLGSHTLTFGGTAGIDFGQSGTVTFSGGGNIVIGSGSDTITMSSAGMVLAGMARHSKTITISPEFNNSTFIADGSVNTDGNMTTENTNSSATNFRNYYEWTSTQATLQDYTIAVRVTLPSDFDAWDTTGVSLFYQTGTANTADNAVSFKLYEVSDGTNIVCDNSTDRASTTWTSTNMTCAGSVLNDNTSSEWDAAGETALIKIKVKANSTASALARVGEIVINYKAKF